MTTTAKQSREETAAVNRWHTANTVADLIQEHWESDLPDAVLEALRPLDGKPVTKRLLDKLPGGKDVWILERAYGMTQIKNRVYSQSQGSAKGGISLLLAHREDAFPLDVNKVEKENPAYFSGRRERNHARMEARNNRELLQQMADVMNDAERAQAALANARKCFEALAGYGEPFSPDRYDLERACGLDETRDQRRARSGLNP